MPIPSNQINVAEVIMNGVVAAGGSNNRVAQFTFHYRRTAISPPLSKTALETVFNTSVAAPILLALNARFSQTTNTVRWVNDAQDAPVPVSRTGVGGVTGDSMPTIQAVFILFRTGLRGRSYRGSKHFFPLSESDTTGPNADVLNAGSIALWTTAITAMGSPITDTSGNIWVPTVLSRKLSQLRTNPTTVTTNDSTLLLLNKRIGRMRHREVRSSY